MPDYKHQHEEYECSVPICDEKGIYIVAQDAGDYFLNPEAGILLVAILCEECRSFAHDNLGMPTIGTVTCSPLHILPN